MVDCLVSLLLVAGVSNKFAYDIIPRPIGIVCDHYFSLRRQGVRGGTCLTTEKARLSVDFLKPNFCFFKIVVVAHCRGQIEFCRQG